MQALVELLGDAGRLLRLVVVSGANIGDLERVVPRSQVVRAKTCKIEAQDHLFKRRCHHRANQFRV